MAFCGLPPSCHSDETDSSESPQSAQRGAGAVVCKDKLWKGRELLKVHFLNPANLQKWGLTTDTIIEWARAWGAVKAFKEEANIKKADIRVKFSESGSSWSMIGMCATGVKSPKPTMMLNLVDERQCPDKKSQRSMVIHEFGHALGLEHEHQRSDFWDTVENHIDVDRMRSDPRVEESISEVGKATCGANWSHTKQGIIATLRHFFGREKESDKTEYDPKSIMHYGFDKMWLKNHEFHDIHKINECRTLNAEEKKYLMGIHERHNGLVEDPSATDIAFLQKCYEET